MNNHSIALAMRFLHKVKGYEMDSHGIIQCDPIYKLKVIHDVGEVLAGGDITARQYLDVLEQEKENAFYLPIEVLVKAGKNPKRGQFIKKDNLMALGRFYYHHALQLVPPPPQLIIHDDGTMISSCDNEEFFLEMKDSFTVKDLITYFYSKTNKPVNQATYQRDVGAFKHMLQFYELDLILYMIDEAFTCAIDMGRTPPQNPLDIQEYNEQAAVLLERRKNICYEEGLDRVILRPI